MRTTAKHRALIIVITFALLLASDLLYSQNELKNWNAAQLNLSITPKLDLRISHLRSFNISNNYNSEFSQSSLQLSYDLTKKWDVAGAYTFGGTTSLTDGGSRFAVKTGYKIFLAKILTWTNSVQGEIHSINETRYHYRLIAHTRLSPKKRLEFLRLSPSVSYHLFYNIGGKAIQYYDSKTNAPSVQNTPDGFHRGRLMISLNSKLSRIFSISAYYMMQREFNLFTDEFHRMNVVRPTNGKVERPFDNYNVIGLSFQCDLDLYPKKN